MRLASARQTHFAESDVRNIVTANLRDLFGRCCSGDEDATMKAARHIVSSYGLGGLPFVQQLIADAKLGLMADHLTQPTEVSQDAATKVIQCTRHLQEVVRSLAKPQRQKWASLLIRVLRTLQFGQQAVVDGLKLLWQADDDPRQTYAQAECELWACLKLASPDFRCDLQHLLLSV